MKRMKRTMALLLALVMLLALTACQKKDESKSDGEYVKEKGTLIIGITEFEPMDYQDADGQWIGFDADMARAFAESLGVTPQFQIIADWDNKVMELEGKTVDVVWNGMTLTDEVISSMECSNPYFNNAQVVIVPADKAEQYQTKESLAGLVFAAENGSAGQAEAEALGNECTPVQDQATALLEVQAGTADAAVIDYLMAVAMTGEGTSYANLTHTVALNEENYGVGFRKGSDLAEALNEFFKASYEDGTMESIADRYGIAGSLIPQ
jgi:polar amino acid transport system substrate-binding protein